MKLRFLLVPLFSLAVVFAQPPAGGPGRPGMRGGGQGGQATALKTYLGLSDTQVTAIHDAQKSVRESQRTTFEQMRTKQQALQALLATSNPDSAAVGKLTQELNALRMQVQKAQEGVHEAVLNLLTPDQKSKLQTLEAASKLQREIGEARALQLLTPPEGGPGMGGRGMGPRGPMGHGGPR